MAGDTAEHEQRRDAADADSPGHGALQSAEHAVRRRRPGAILQLSQGLSPGGAARSRALSNQAARRARGTAAYRARSHPDDHGRSDARGGAARADRTARADSSVLLSVAAVRFSHTAASRIVQGISDGSYADDGAAAAAAADDAGRAAIQPRHGRRRAIRRRTPVRARRSARDTDPDADVE